MDELPYHYLKLHLDGKPETEVSPYFNDLSWIYDKVYGSNSFQILEDIHLIKPLKLPFTKLLQDFLELNATLINYDGRQFYSHLHRYIEKHIKDDEVLNNPTVQETVALSKNPPVLSLIPLNGLDIEERMPFDSTTNFQSSVFDLVVRIPDTDHFVVTVSTQKEEICVWDIRK